MANKMIMLMEGNILDSDADALVNPVNCDGIMGRGLALGFKKKYPDNFEAYRTACNAFEVYPGRVFVFELNTLTNPQYIINFPTKINWWKPSQMEWIEEGLIDLARVIQTLGIQSVAIPALGCGLGGLKWPAVKTRIEIAMSMTTAFVYPPRG